jgi:hypothetical protein
LLVRPCSTSTIFNRLITFLAIYIAISINLLSISVKNMI